MPLFAAKISFKAHWCRCRVINHQLLCAPAFNTVHMPMHWMCNSLVFWCEHRWRYTGCHKRERYTFNLLPKFKQNGSMLDWPQMMRSTTADTL
jgi:hypothetical protein